MEQNPQETQKTNTQEQQKVDLGASQVISRESDKKKWPYILALSILMLAAITAWFYYHQPVAEQIQQEASKNFPTIAENTQPGTKTWLNCREPRKVITEQGKQYAACSGGVMIVDQATGKVVDQVTMADGLGNNTVTDLVKKGNKLYIGTQDGFTIFDLVKRTAQKISVEEGLVNGSNIEFADAGDELWIATFDGVSRYDYATGKIINYMSELAKNSSKYNTWAILNTSKAIYVSITANAYSPGGMARFDKANQTWEIWGPESFEGLNSPTRLDATQILSVNGKVYIHDGSRVYVQDDARNQKWNYVPAITDGLNKFNKNYYVNFLTIIGNNLMMKSEQDIFYYETTTGAFGDLKSASSTLSMEYQKWLNNSTLATVKNMPDLFGQVLGKVNDKVFFTGSGDLWALNTKDNSLTRITNSGLIYTAEFVDHLIPVAGADKIYVFMQVCGMGCEKPDIYSVNVVTLAAEKLDLTNLLKTVGTNDIVYGEQVNHGAEIVLREPNDPTKKIIYDLTNNSWRMEDVAADNQYLDMGIARCNYDLTYSSSKGIGNLPTEGCDKVVSDGTSTYSFNWQDQELSQTTGGVKKIIRPILEEPAYTPFEKSYNYSVSAMTFANGKLYVATSRGLAVYDPKSETWGLISVKEGLPSMEIRSMLISDSNVFVITSAGMTRIQADK